jgi:hypothetical protein
VIFARSDYSNIFIVNYEHLFQLFSETFEYGGGAGNSSFSVRNRIDFVEC